MLERRFVLIPLLELDFELRTPAGESLADALAALPLDEGVRRAGPPLAVAAAGRGGPADRIIRHVLLVVDVGNTQTHFGGVREGEVVEHWRFATDRSSTSDELGAALRNLLALRGLGFDDIDASALSSTVPELAPEWVEMARRYLGHEMLVVGPGRQDRHADPHRQPARARRRPARQRGRRVGALRRRLHRRRLRHRDHLRRRLGRGRVPRRDHLAGLEISLEALARRAAKLPQVELGEPRSLIGKTTVDAVRSGIVYGFAGQVDGIVARLREELGADTPVIATGGLAHHLVPSFTESIDAVDDLLTLEGLRLIWELNR